MTAEPLPKSADDEHQAAFDIPSWIWWSNLERILLAVDDLGCRELLT